MNDFRDTGDVSIPSLPVRLVETIMNPGRLFEALRDRPVWFGTAATVAVLTAVLMAVAPSEVYMQGFEQALSDNPDPDQTEAALEMMGPFMPYMAAGGTLITIPILILAQGAVAFVIFGIALGYGFSFKQGLSVVAHATIISVLGTIVGLAAVLATGNPLMINLTLGTLVPGIDPETFLGSFLSMLRLFEFWFFAVVAAGLVAMASGRGAAGKTWGKTYGYALALWVAFCAIAATIF